MLWLSRELLQSIVPFALAKVNRVSYGLLSAEQIADGEGGGDAAAQPRAPRRPLVGKDAPSRASEFSHPDVVITLTILAFRRTAASAAPTSSACSRRRSSGWAPSTGRTRSADVPPLGRLGRGEEQRAALPRDEGRRPPERAGCRRRSALEVARRRFVGGAVLERRGRRRGGGVAAAARRPRRRRADRGAVRAAPRPAAGGEGGALHVERHLRAHDDIQQMKLSASGQELGSDLLFNRRLGFSGTPSNLLPVELGKCEHTPPATTPRWCYVTAHVDLGTTALARLGRPLAAARSRRVAAAARADRHRRRRHRLLDQPARWRRAPRDGAPPCAAPWFLDEHDRKMILLREGLQDRRSSSRVRHRPRRPLLVLRPGAHDGDGHPAAARRARAALALGKAHVVARLRAGRLPGCAASAPGQRIELLMTPEVERLVDDAILKCARRTRGAVAAEGPRRAAQAARAPHAPAARRRQGGSTRRRPRRRSRGRVQGALFAPARGDGADRGRRR